MGIKKGNSKPKRDRLRRAGAEEEVGCARRNHVGEADAGPGADKIGDLSPVGEVAGGFDPVGAPGLDLQGIRESAGAKRRTGEDRRRDGRSRLGRTTTPRISEPGGAL